MYSFVCCGLQLLSACFTLSHKWLCLYCRTSTWKYIACSDINMEACLPLLVTDTILRYLSISDLKQVSLVNNYFTSNGGNGIYLHSPSNIGLRFASSNIGCLAQINTAYYCTCDSSRLHKFFLSNMGKRFYKSLLQNNYSVPISSPISLYDKNWQACK